MNILAHYFLLTVCGGRLIATNSVKHFYSHSNYGDLNYDSDATCEWTIEAKSNMNVHLTFLTFELEEEKNCMYDYVEVWSSLDTSGPFFGRFCGPTVSVEPKLLQLAVFYLWFNFCSEPN